MQKDGPGMAQDVPGMAQNGPGLIQNGPRMTRMDLNDPGSMWNGTSVCINMMNGQFSPTHLAELFVITCFSRQI